MTNDKKILEKVTEIRKSCEAYISYVTELNPCAYTDRMLEKLIAEGKELETLYDNNTV